jgi:O-succinylbenzoic acid--CoA ligase
MIVLAESEGPSGLHSCIRAVEAKLAGFGKGPIYAATSRDDAASAPAQLGGFPFPRDAMVLLRTSGSTTGTGRLVVLTDTQLRASATASSAVIGGPGRWVTCLPITHIAGFQTVYRSVLAGKEPIYAGSGRPAELRAAVARLDADELAFLSLVPTQLIRLLNMGEAAPLRRFHAVLVGGAACPPEALRKARAAGVRVVTTYGMTETCGGCVYDGQPIGDTRIETDLAGRITIAGSVVGTGYAGAEPFYGRFVTNDAGELDANGRLRILGRLDNAITTGALTISPSLTEAELQHLGAGECAVVGVPDPQWGEIVIAVTTEPLIEDETKLHIRQKLNREHAPRRIFSLEALGLDDFPRLNSGKIDRRALSALLEEKGIGY